ncbi:antitoxin VapB family protein [Candidatus Woesearchaeota archaeon]|nr:antitoxin VapB family protein [Candidatus Woesearchaeota archaeon]
MATKNIAITEQAYELLVRNKLPGRSFSEVIREHFTKKKLTDYAGLWADVPEKAWKELELNVAEARKGLSESLKKRISALK